MAFWGTALLFVSGLCYSAARTVSQRDHYPMSFWWHLLLPVIVVGGLLMLVGFVLMHVHDGSDLNSSKFCSEVSTLFHQFGIKPTEEIGNLNQEEFTSLVAEILSQQAARVECAQGVDRITERAKFKLMHATALEWKLCVERWDSYFPTKGRKVTVTV